MKNHSRFVLTLLTAALIVTAGFSQAQPEQSESNILRLGKVTSNPQKQYKRIQPMAELLAAELGYDKGLSLFTRNIEGMLQKLHNGEVDVFTGSAYEAAILIHSGAGEVLALKHKEGVHEYRSIVVVRSDSGIDSIDQLRGKTIAFEDEDSTSAFRVPRMEMEKAGLKLTEDGISSPVDELVHYRFSGSEQNSSAWLYRGTVDAIALSNLDWARSDNVPAFQQERFKIIFSSRPIPRAVEVVRASMSQTARADLRQALINLQPDGEVTAIMRAYHKTTQFSPVDSDTIIYLEELADYYSN